MYGVSVLKNADKNVHMGNHKVQNLQLTTASLSGGWCQGYPGASTFGKARSSTKLRPHGRQTRALQP